MEQEPSPAYTPPTTWLARVSLAEVLACIAIVATLLAVLMPLVQRQRASASWSSCFDQGRLLSQGLLMYAQDYSDTLPEATRWQKLVVVFPSESLPVTADHLYCPEQPIRYRAVHLNGYALDGRLSQLRLDTLTSPRESRIALYEAPYTVTATPGIVFQGRHRDFEHPRSRGKGWVGFLDGHIATLSTEEVESLSREGTYP